jgi:energy-coupling factor transport system substrate-specific component
MGGRTLLALTLVSAIGLAAFTWPLLVSVAPGASGHVGDAPVVFVVVLPLLLAVLLAEFADGGIDARSLAVLAVLAGLGAALRPLGAGTAGIETVFFLLIVGGRAVGPGFGFLLGTTTLLASAVVTGGVGPWLPFQMLAAGWVGLGAGLLPAERGRRELGLLVVYGIAASYAYGLLMNLWFWPFALGTGTELSYRAGAPITEQLGRFGLYVVVTSLGWDTGRAITTTVLLVLAGPAMLAVVRRAVRRASFGTPATFDPGDAADVDAGEGGSPRLVATSQADGVDPGVFGVPSARTTATPLIE